MSKEIKNSHKVFMAWDYDKEEDYINNKSKEGWQLIKGGCFNSKYQKDISKRYIYKIDFNYKAISNSKSKQMYLDMFEADGWEYISSTFNGWSYFRKPYDENLKDEDYQIYSDSDSYSEMLNRWLRLGKVLRIIIGLMIPIYIFLTIREHSLYMGALTCMLVGFFIAVNIGIDKINKKIL